MRQYLRALVFTCFGTITSLGTAAAQSGPISAGALILQDGSGNTLTVWYPNSPPVAGNSFYTFPPGGGAATPGGTVNGQTLWWKSSSSAWSADNFLTNTGSAIGIGTPTPSWPLDLERTISTVSNSIGANVQLKLQPSGASGSRYIGVSGWLDAANGFSLSGQIEGIRGEASVGQMGVSTQPVSLLAGTIGSAENSSSQTVTEADGTVAQVVNWSSGNITTANALKSAMFTFGGTLTNARSLYVQGPSVGGTITNLYGLYMDQQLGGTNVWPIFLSDGTASGSLFDVTGNGYVGIGNSSPGSPLDLMHTFTSTGGTINGANLLTKVQPSGVSSAVVYGSTTIADAENANAISGQVVGMQGLGTVGVFGASSASVNLIAGTTGDAENNTAQSVTTADGLVGQIFNVSSGTMTTANAVQAAVFNTSTGTLTNARGFYVQQPLNTGTITNLYGLYVDPLTAGSNNWPMFLSDGTPGGSIFDVTGGGNVGIGTSVPAWPLDLRHTFTSTSSSVGAFEKINVQPSGPSSARYVAFSADANAQNANSITGGGSYVLGVFGAATADVSASQPIDLLFGSAGSAQNSSSQTISQAFGVDGEVVNWSSGIMTTTAGFRAEIFNLGTGTIGDARGIYVLNPFNSGGTITNAYGIYIDPMTGGTNNWPIFLSDGVGGARFAVDAGGNVGVGTATPSSTLQVVGSFRVGTSTDARNISNIVQYNFIYDFPSTAAQTGSVVSVSLPGTAPSMTDGIDDVLIEVPDAIMSSVTGTFTAWVQDATHIKVRFNNYSSTAQDPASATYYVTVITH